MLAAAAIVVAVLATLLGALVWGLAMETPSADAWKFRVKAIGLGPISVGSLGFSLGAALFIGVSLLVALGLVDSSSSPLVKWGRLVEVGAAGAAGWLAFFTLLGLVVDLTEIADAFPDVVGAVLIDLGTLLILAVAGFWGLRTFIPRR